ncbi:ATP-binding protein [Pseudomonas sp. KU26590]|uniref:ATP-binding protein n=1 Tax=Pseudomonas sp. KU26590 TaxID=2991051 RepID=UPI00223D4ED8|nr:ATP-binding protein [Pseudomonas sp. KU26590]UZJ62619.1 ATP-binding protein [Pseudomonas sp. KU26590]
MSSIFNGPYTAISSAGAFGPQWLEQVVWQLLFVDGELAHYRVTLTQDDRHWRIVRPAPGASISAIRRLEHEFSLAPRLVPQWAVQPVALLSGPQGTLLVLEDASGVALHDQPDAPLSIEVFLQRAIAAAAAVTGAHQAGLVHRDIKPCNLIEGADGVVRLSGFGLSVDVQSAPQLAVSDTVFGSLAYIAPEQSRRVQRHADQRSDLYALGMTFYEWLVGRLPFGAADAVEWVYCHVARIPPPLSQHRGDIPGPLAGLVHRLIAKNPDDRYPSAAALHRELSEMLQQWRQFRDIPDLQSDLPDRRHDASTIPVIPSPNPAPGMEKVSSTRTSVTLAGREALDLSSVMKSAHALRDESEQDRLIETLLRNTIVHAGAQRALLLLVKDEAPVICAIGQGGDDGLRIELTDTVPDKHHLPLSILYRVMRTRQRLVLDDVCTDAYFGADEYVRQHPVRSALCVPLVKQGRVLGVLYLENNLAPGVFTLCRTEVLELLASQAAISLETARLHQELEQENARRRDVEIALRGARARLASVAQATVMGELAASIAHEINQPLASMVSNAAAGIRWLNRENPQVDEALSALRDIVAEGRRAGEIVNALHSLARQGPHHRRRLLVNDVIRHVVSLTGVEVEQQRVLMTTHLTCSPLRVCASDVQLQQVVLNLILNALDAMSAGDHVLRRLSITSEVVGRDYVVVSVEDSGRGIEPVDLPQLFNAFFTTKDKGMGMGLAICQSIISAQGGHLYAMPARYGGATFVFTLPIVE